MRGTARSFTAFVLPLAAIAILAAARIPYPLHGDQTVFLMGAEAMHKGGVLYVDFWDTKQPGIFLFYWLAGTLFGFNPVGVHLFELLWNLVLAAWMIRVLRPRLASPVLASMAPIFAIGGYYAVAGTWELTQAEMLASLPLFACFAGATARTATPRATRLLWFASGLAAGVAVLFKLLFALIPAGIWYAAALASRRAGETSWPDVFRDRWLPAVLGAALLLGVATAAFAAAGALQPLLWTAFAYPLQAIGGGKAEFGRLASTGRWALAAFWPLLLLMVLSGYRRRDMTSDRFSEAAFAWWGLGVMVLSAQTLSWWRYHVMLVLAPTALLAARGLDALVGAARERWRWPGAFGTAAGLLLAVLACVPFLRTRLGEPLLPPRLENAQELIAYQRHVSPAVDAIWTDTAFLRAPDAQPGPIYAFGDPRAITLTGRTQAIAINGWSWESYAQRQWDALPAALEAAAPAYVGVEPPYEPLIRRRAPRAWAWLERNYRVVQAGRERVWYERIASGTAPDGG